MSNLPCPEPETTVARKKPVWPKVVVSLLLLSALSGAGFWLWCSVRIGNCRPSLSLTGAKTLERAIISFTNEYGDRFPVTSTSGDTFLETSMDNELVKTLCGHNPEANPLRMDFLGDVRIARPDRLTGKLTFGLVVEDERLAFVDASGHPYRILMDTDRNSELDNPDTKNAGTKLRIRSRVLVWGAGEDGLFETWEDNVKSWE